MTDDLIGRAEAQTAIQFAARRYTVAHEAHGEGQVVWSDNLINVTDAMNVLRDLPPAQPEQRWIPCSERLPEDEYVLISKKPTKISGDKWCVAIAIRMSDPRSRKIQWRDSGFGVIQDDKVLAWMPLPEPYQEGEQE